MLSGILGVAGFVLVIIFGLAQLAVGFIGIEYGMGAGWGYGALFLSVFFRITLPITIGAFFGAMDVLGWHWFWAAAFAAPGLLFMAPSVVAGIFGRAAYLLGRTWKH